MPPRRCGLSTLQQHVISAGSSLGREVPPGSGTNTGVGRRLQAFLHRSVWRTVLVGTGALPSATWRREGTYLAPSGVAWHRRRESLAWGGPIDALPRASVSRWSRRPRGDWPEGQRAEIDLHSFVLQREECPPWSGQVQPSGPPVPSSRWYLTSDKRRNL